MSQLVTITSKIYDASGRYVINLKVKSRYKGSSRENSAKTDSKGFFIFQASPNRIVEILAKPPNVKDYMVFKTINSSLLSSTDQPAKVRLPKTIEEYRESSNKIPKNGLVVTLFKVVDSNGKEMANFPVRTRPKGGKIIERLTDEKGHIEVQSSPNREIEFLVLNVTDEFILKKSLNSMNGTQEPILIKLDEPYKNFLSTSAITLLDRDGNDYIIEKTKIEILNINTREQVIYSTSNGQISLRSMVGEKLQFTVLKPDGKPLNPIFHIVKRVKEKPIKLHLDVDVINGTSTQNKPSIYNNLEVSECACNRDIVNDEFKKITKSTTALTFLKDLNAQFKRFNMNSCLEKAHFIAHTLHETASYTLMEERLGGKPESSVYDGYKGRGLMQLTYKTNYNQYGLAVNENFLEKNKYRIAVEKRHAVGSAIWYWHHSKAGNLSSHALRNDLIATCALINGGYNGFDDREKYYKKSVVALKIDKCKNLESNIINALDDFTKFEDSYIYSNKIGECFGWGLWNDPGGKKKGKTKNINEAKKGYVRFLEMSKNKDFPFGYTINKSGKKISRKRYGYSADAAIFFAKKRLKEL